MSEFLDRRQAGRRLARLLEPVATADTVVLGLPRGGVLVAAEAARALGLPLDVVVVRKVGLPGRPELAMGAVGESGVLVRNEDVLRRGWASEADFAEVVARERVEVEQRVRRWRADERLDLTGRPVLLVDDGIATGATVRAACAVVRRLGATRVVVATPVAPPDLSAADLGADALIAAVTPREFRAVGLHYADFDQTTDAEVGAALAARG